MKSRHLFGGILVAFFVFRSAGAFAQQTSFTIDILTSYDYPGVGNSTTGVAINDRGEIAGRYTDTSTSVTRGFVRFRNGTFSSPIVEPDDGTTTFASGINNARIVCGDFISLADNADHGFLLSGNVFTQFDVSGAISTDLHEINDRGNLVGFFTSAAQLTQAFVNIGGITTVITIPGALFSDAEGINGGDEVVGSYTDSASFIHSFFRDVTGMLRFPIDFPGAAVTQLESINDQGEMTGRYNDSAGLLHGFFFKRPNIFVSFDYPGALSTSLNGINNHGIISGRYTDSSGIRHGFVARVRRASN